jgi:phage terminase large subunit-like protein
MNAATNLRAALRRSWKAGKLTKTLSALPELRRWLDEDFIPLCHPHQEPPAVGNNGKPWTTWLVLGGRGAGKTRLGAEWVRAAAYATTPYADRRHRHIALVGESEHDVREVMIEGVSGLLRISPRDQRPLWLASRRRLEWPNGAVAQAFSAEDPESLRGPQFDAAWCDELAKWRRAGDAFDMLQFGLRLGARPRQLITTTPRPTALIKRLIADPRTAVTRAATHANAAHLSPAFLEEIVQRYEGTRLGRQEILGEIIEDRPDALWSRSVIEAARVRAAPPLARIVVGIDPPAGSRQGSDACGIVAAGRAEDGTIYVLEDATAAGLSPAGWAARAIAVYRRHEADTLVAEVNQGGEMVRAVIRQVDADVPLKTVHATRGKWVRAEPVAAMYSQGRVKHVDPARNQAEWNPVSRPDCAQIQEGPRPDAKPVPTFAGRGLAELEDQMCDVGVDGLASGRSPDRLDALVWAVSELTRPRAEPRIRLL